MRHIPPAAAMPSMLWGGVTVRPWSARLVLLDARRNPLNAAKKRRSNRRTAGLPRNRIFDVCRGSSCLRGGGCLGAEGRLRSARRGLRPHARLRRNSSTSAARSHRRDCAPWGAEALRMDDNDAILGQALAGPRRTRRAVASSGKVGARDRVSASCAAVDSLLTFCPPGPEARTKLMSKVAFVENDIAGDADHGGRALKWRINSRKHKIIRSGAFVSSPPPRGEGLGVGVSTGSAFP